MDRLTYRDESGKAVKLPYVHAPEVVRKLAAYEDTGLEPEQVREVINSLKIQILDLNQNLRNYRKAEFEGRLIVLPCKVGDTVWFVVIDDENQADNEVEGLPVTEAGSRGFWTADTRGDTTSMNAFTPWEELGQRVFLTKQEAEAALGGDGE